ncbi:hypothetical protein D0Z03_001233 [Geotrichum reessii]|nr:hypothetical protein D0Z03_001233 [Galactomyces reessii]
MLPENTTVLSQVQAALENGVTLVQLREKTAETREFIELAHKVHELTKQCGVPLIINDRVDVALAINAEGVHVGQGDMPAAQVRAMIGPNKIVGVSVHDERELEGVLALNKPGEPKVVDYIGIGAIYGTKTKDLKEKHPIGVYGLKRLLELNNAQVETVAIGGINASNVQKVFYGSRVSDSVKLDGVAVVSCIMASKDAAGASRNLTKLIKAKPLWMPQQLTKSIGDSVPALSVLDIEETIREFAPRLLHAVTQRTPFIHHVTNNVVKNFSANVTLAIGASPAMSECAGEFSDFSQITPSAALLINTGLPSTANIEDDGAEIYLGAAEEYNKRGLPVTLDPVGVGASKMRRELMKKLLESAFFNVVKGNQGEIFTLYRDVSGLGANEDTMGVSTKGVDSVGTASIRTSLRIGRKLARHYKTTMLMTGVEDIVSDRSGTWNVVLNNGHKYMDRITGSGCSLGSVVSACLAVASSVDTASTIDSDFLAAATAVLIYTIAGERAAARPEVRGPGTFLPAFIDELYLIAEESRNEDFSWIKEAKFRVISDAELNELDH